MRVFYDLKGNPVDASLFGDVLPDGYTVVVRTPLYLSDGMPGPDHALPAGSVRLADGGVKQIFADGTGVIVADGRARYIDVAGNHANSLSAAQLEHIERRGGEQHADAAISDSQRAHAIMGDSVSRAWSAGPARAPTEMVLPQDVVDAMTPQQRANILPALNLVNQSDATMRPTAIAQLRMAVRKVTESRPGITADGADNHRLHSYVQALCDAAAGG